MKALKLSLTCLALGLAACNGAKEADNSDEFLAAVPEQAALELSINDDPSSEGLATSSDQIATDLATAQLGAVSDALTADIADGLRGPQQAVRELNQTLRDFLQPIVSMVRNTEPDQIKGNVAMWGPVTRGATEYRFVVRKGLAKHFGWVLQGRVDGSSDDFTNVAAGTIAVGATVRRGTGKIGVDLDAFASVDPTVVARGKLLAAFSHGPNGTVLAYGLKDFTREDGDTTPINAAFEGVHLRGGYNRVRLAFHGNLPETDTDAAEFLLARVRNHRGTGGRADLLVSGGDVPDGRVWVVAECWNAELRSAFRAVLDCPADGIGGAACDVKSTVGVRTACLLDLRQAELPPVHPEEHLDDPESPDADLIPPDAMPTGAAE